MAKAVLEFLCDVIYESKDKRTCQLAIWCIVQQNLSDKVVAKQVNIAKE